MKPLYVRVHARDNVGIIVNPEGLAAGVSFDGGPTLREAIPQSHKVALRPIAAGAPVIRYGEVIGLATRAMEAGDWVREDSLRLPAPPALDDLPLATATPPPLPPLEGYTFDGYRNTDGSVGARNILGITTTVQCVAPTVEYAVRRIKAELLPRYPNVDDATAITHSYGCGVAIDAPGAAIPIRTIRNISLHPNLGGWPLVVSLGCEKMQPGRLFPAPGAGAALPVLDGEPHVIRMQDHELRGFGNIAGSIMRHAEQRLEELNRRARTACPASGLVVGLQCGGSDAFSGVTCNPAVGFAADLLVRAGATVMFSEVTEVRDAIDQLTARAATPEVAQAMVREMAWYDAYLQRGRVDRSANTTPGNKKGGLSNIVEKAMGSIVKSGSAPISGVLAPGEKLARGQRGLIYAATPASDFICGTLQLAAGMNLHVFTTGRGTPYGLAECPVVKVATRSELARRWHDLMDVDAGRIASGERSIEDMGWELFHRLLAVASGERTWAERHRLHNALVLFNPAPVT